MGDDRRWMYDGWRKNVAPSDEWAINTKAFISRAFSLTTNRFVKCPCSKCRNLYCKDKFEMERDLCKFGFMPGYETWYEHGEVYHSNIVVDETNGKNKDRTVEALDCEYGADESEGNLGTEKVHEHTKMSVLEIMTGLMSIKSEHNLSNECFDELYDLLLDSLPKNHKLPPRPPQGSSSRSQHVQSSVTNLHTPSPGEDDGGNN